MKEYSVRYCAGGCLMTIDEDFRKPKKFETLEEARAEVENKFKNSYTLEEVEEYNKLHPHTRICYVSYCKIYKGRTCIEKIER